MRHASFFAGLLALAACRSTEPPPAPPAEPQKTASVPALPIIPAGEHAAPAKPKPGDPRAEKFAQLQKERSAVWDAYYELFKEGMTDAQMQEVARTNQAPDDKVFSARGQALLDEDPSDETAFAIISWMLNIRDSESDAKKLLAALEKYHFQRPEMAQIVSGLDAGGNPGMRALLEKLAEASPHAGVRGESLFVLAETAKSERELARELKETPAGKEREQLQGYVGAERSQRLLAADDAELERAAVKLYERVIAEYGEVAQRRGRPSETTLGSYAETALFEIRNLAIGKPAPEIAAADLTGIPFKLSDYRGKVVLLDFWGYW